MADLAEIIQHNNRQELAAVFKELGFETDANLAAQQLEQLFFDNKGSKSILRQRKDIKLMTLLSAMADRSRAFRKEQLKSKGNVDKEPLIDIIGFIIWLIDINDRPLLKLGIIVGGTFIILITLGVIFLYSYRKFTGTSGLLVKVQFNRAFHSDFFIGRLSATQLGSGFGDIMGSFRRHRLRGSKTISKFWRTLFPFKAVADMDIIHFKLIPPGKYYLYVASIQIDAKTKTPVGSVEVDKIVRITDEEKEINVSFQEDQAYVGVKVVNMYRLVSSSDTVGADTTKVTLTVNRNKANTYHGELNKEIGLNLKPGTHEIVANSGEFEAKQTVVIGQDVAPQWIEMYLESARMKLARKVKSDS